MLRPKSRMGPIFTIVLVLFAATGTSVEAPMTSGLAATPVAHACPANLSAWQKILGAEWLDCHQVPDLTTTNNPWTDPSSLYGMGFPPPGSGTLNSHYTNPTTPAVSGLQPHRGGAPRPTRQRPAGGRLRRGFGSGGRIRTGDLRVMSPTSCHCSTPRRGGDGARAVSPR